MKFRFDLISFLSGMASATLVWWIVALIRPVLDKLIESMKARRTENIKKSGSDLEDAYLKAVYKQTQGMHLASSLFALDEVIETPRLLAPPIIEEPHASRHHLDVVEQCLPYLIQYPELGAFYNSRTLSVLQALSGGANIAIIGQPGTGKTTALAHLATIIAKFPDELKEMEGYIPFLIHVADLALPLNNPQQSEDYLEPIIEHLAPLMGMIGSTKFPKFVKNTFSEGRALLLLDGVDELPQSGIQEVAGYLRVLLRQYKGTRVVLSGAPEYLDGIISLGFTPLAIMPWSKDQQVHFLKNWTELWQKHVQLESWTGKAYVPVDNLLIERWVSDENFGLTPLEYTLKIWGACAGDVLSTLPVDTISAHIRRLTPEKIPVEALSILAVQASTNESPQFNLRRAQEWTKSFDAGYLDLETATPAPEQNSSEDLEPVNVNPVPVEKSARQDSHQAKASLVSALVNSGLLSSHRGNKLRFSHPVFLAHLTGLGLAAYPAHSKTIMKQSSWSGQTGGLCHMVPFGDATGIINELLTSDDHILLRPKLLAGRLLRRSSKKQKPVWVGQVMAALAQVLQNGDLPIGLRTEAVISLALSGDPTAGILFRQLLLTNSDTNNYLGALGSGLLRDAKAVEALIAVTSAAGDFVRRASCLALVEIGTSQSLEAAAVFLLKGDEQLRVYAAEALANNPVEGIEALREGISSDDILLRRAVVYGLARVPEKWAAELLEKIQLNDEQWAVRNVAVEIIQDRQIPDPHIPRKLTPPHEAPWLIEFAGKYGMGVGPGQPATDIFLLALKDPDKDLFRPSLAYLKNNPTEGVLASLYHHLYDTDLEIREDVFQTLSHMALSGVSLPDPRQFGLG